MIIGSPLVGLMGATALPVVAAFDAATFDSTAIISHSYNLSIGTADAKRTVIVCVGTNNGPSIVSSITVNGLTPTLIYSGNANFYAIYIPTGTTATVNITTTTNARLSVATYSLINLTSYTPVNIYNTDNSGTSLSQSIDVPVDGCAISIGMMFNATASTWSNTTETYDVYQTGLSNHTGALTSSPGAKTITCTKNGSGLNYMTTLCLR